MKQILYDCTDANKRQESHKKAGKTLQDMPEGYEYLITIKRNKPVRSLSQNNFFHMLLTIYANHIGLYLDEMKGEFYDAIGFYEMITDKRGKETKRYKSSADLDQGEMAGLISALIQYGSTNMPECIIPRQEDANYMQWMTVQNDYNRATAGW